MNESTILLVAMEKCIVRLPILYFWFDQFHLQYFDFCIQHPALFKETYYFINIIINSQPTTEWLKLPNHFCQCEFSFGTLYRSRKSKDKFVNQPHPIKIQGLSTTFVFLKITFWKNRKFQYWFLIVLINLYKLSW